MNLEAPRDEVLTQKDQANTCVSTAWLRLSLVLVFIMPGKPVRFSNGLEVPALPDMVTGFGAFIITFFGLTILLILGLRYYERHFARPKPDA
jgi:hypothetical protein